MAEEILVDAHIREDIGKNSNRRLRVQGMIPSILYGVTDENISLSVKPRDIELILRSKRGANTLFHINMVGERTTKSTVMIKDYQIDPVRDELIHCDFIRINLDEMVITGVPIHVEGKPKGVTEQGGLLELVVRELEVECLPTDIPESVIIDVSEFMIGDGARLNDLGLGDEKVRYTADEELLILHVIPPKKIEEEEEEEIEGEEGIEGEETEGEEAAEEKPEK